MNPLTWTETPPTAPGWYWMQVPWNSPPECVEVYRAEADKLRVHYGTAPVNHTPAMFPPGTRWAGPILPPQEPTT